ncbi:hypothetical protein [Dactylosporangium sp. CA-233914]|uniref:hypothetical protein n=1 Tax=Dactylosporangium sp. CA-233914 TaxID=3239934 RepID=UPI003D927C1F
MTTTAQPRTRGRSQPKSTDAAQAATRRPSRARKATEPPAAAKTAEPEAPAKAAEPEAAAKPAEPERAAEGPETERVTWHEVPMPHVKVPVVHMGAADAGSAVERVRWTTRTIVSAIPFPRPGPTRLLYYGGVGALAVLGVLDWPVAVAAAAGVWVATRGRRTATVAG